MHFFITVNGRRIKQGMLVLLVSLFTALLLYSQTTVHIPVFKAQDGPKAIFKGEKGVALTFNISWGDVQAAPILDVLKEKDVRSATFFLSGSWAERHPDLVKRISDMGYEIGSLGYAYEDYTEIEADKVRRDITQSLDVFKKLGIKEVKLLRSPTGHFDKQTISVADRLGLTVVHWSINSQDWKTPGTKAIIEATSKAKEGDIILLHASDSATQTANALPSIIDALRKKGELITVSNMIANGKVKTTLVP